MKRKGENSQEITLHTYLHIAKNSFLRPPSVSSIRQTSGGNKLKYGDGRRGGKVQPLRATIRPGAGVGVAQHLQEAGTARL